jgi:putative transposase
MAGYVRWYVPGGTYFFTLVTERRAPLFADADNRRRLHDAIAECRRTRPFDLVATVLLPDHLHAIWTLPDDDVDFSTRWNAIKSHFTRTYLAPGGTEQSRSASRKRHRNRGVWQRRFHEHLCRNELDLGRRVEYIHFQPGQTWIRALPARMAALVVSSVVCRGALLARVVLCLRRRCAAHSRLRLGHR